MIGTIIEIGLEIYKNKEKIRVAFQPKYLNYDLNKLFSHYINEEKLLKNIPYIELVDLSKNKQNIKFSIIKEEFKLDYNNSIAIKSFQTEALKEFKNKGKFIYDSKTVRLNKIKYNNGLIILEIQKSKYSDQIQSHLVLDWNNRHLRDIGTNTLRGILLSKYGNKLPPLNTTLLSNSIGISVVIYYKKNNLLIPYLPFRNKSYFNKKKNEPALYEGIYHCSSSGVLEWDDFKTMYDITEQMYREINEEIGLEKGDISELKPISLTRELLRSGKPQIFFFGTTNLSEKELIEKRKLAIIKATNKDDKIEIQNKHLPFVNDSELKRSLISLETIGNLYFCDKYLSNNEIR